MELVYLWIEDYKNINNQGFNFSPRFECEFKDGVLTIDENKNYVSIFPDNINVTAIVGENGSGKSNLIDLLYIGTSPMGSYFYIFDSGQRLEIKGITINGQPSEVITNNKINKTIFTKLKKLTLNCGNIEGSVTLNNQKLSFIYYSNMLSDIKNIETKCIIGQSDKNKFNISDSYLIDYYIKHEFEMKKKAESHYVSFENQYKLFKNKNIQNTINMIKNVDIKLPIPIPNKVYINVYINDFKDESRKYLNEINLSALTFLEKVKVNIITNFLDYSLSTYKYKNKLLGKIKITDLKSIDNIFDSFDAVFSIEHKIKDDTHILPINPYIDIFEKAKLFIKSIDSLEEKIQYERLVLNIIDINDDFIEMYQQLTLVSLDFFHFEWHPDLSSGQENLLFQFARFYSLKLDRFSNRILKDDVFIFIDEGENTLHPKWQKYYIKYLVEFFSKNFSQKINLIFSSHSPFILSDIPKENVIFLDKFDEKAKEKYPKLNLDALENGNCINVSEYIELKTFGANIHTLLANGFFMSDGLMGQFAKSKIDNVIKKLKDKNYNPSKIEKENILATIKIIGEDFLRTKLLDMYYKKFDDDFIKKQRKEELLEQQKKIKKELKNL